MKKLFYLFTILFAGLFAACDNGQYVDLGLPSGTLWCAKNEGGDHARYTYDEAISNFGSKLPAKEQLEELKNQCTWTWTGSGYKVVGPNGNSIYFPAAGGRDCYGHVFDVGSGGSFWSSTPYGLDEAYLLSFYSYKVDVGAYYRCRGRSVRLVQVSENPSNPTTGSIVAKQFSVSANKTVTFSPGNLQYHPANNEWRFAPSQADYIGKANKNISSTYNGWIDLFGWGTGNNPTNKSAHDYQIFVDWGVNKIGNDAPNTWRTLTDGEWGYLCWSRPNADKLIGVAQVNGVNGLILLPDSWTCPSGVTFKSGLNNNYGTEYYASYQTFSSSEWTKLEASGAVFLPAVGSRDCSGFVNYVGSYGGYWSSTPDDWNYAYYLGIDSGKVYVYSGSRCFGGPVRLVQD